MKNAQNLFLVCKMSSKLLVLARHGYLAPKIVIPTDNASGKYFNGLSEALEDVCGSVAANFHFFFVCDL